MHRITGWVRRHPWLTGLAVLGAVYFYAPLWPLYPRCHSPPEVFPPYSKLVRAPQSDDYRSRLKILLNRQGQSYWDTGSVLRINTITLFANWFDSELDNWMEVQSEAIKMLRQHNGAYSNLKIDDWHENRCDLVIPRVSRILPTD